MSVLHKIVIFCRNMQKSITNYFTIPVVNDFTKLLVYLQGIVSGVGCDAITGYANTPDDYTPKHTLFFKS